MEKCSWTDCVKNEEISHMVKKEKISYITVRIKKANWIGHILHRNSLLKTLLKVR
jgi:hypothetical protein